MSDQFRHYIYSLFILVEFLFFAAFIWINIKRKAIKLILFIISVAYSLFLIIYTLKTQIAILDSISIGIESIVILIFSFYFLYELMNEHKTSFFYTDYRFWIVLGFIVYLSGSFFVYIFAEQLDPAEWKKFRFLTWVFYIIKAILFTVSIFVYNRHSKQNTFKDKTIPYLDLI